MPDIIRLLPDSVANQIAAGEVIQRPSSAIKELVENAVDAGATKISVVVKDAGKTMIQVIDNGIGMSETDARMAFERHATSKIRNADDLFTLHTMGFRGEALPSICAISEVEIKTRTADSSLGTQLIIAGSKVQSQEPCVCEKGTVLTIRKLFFNVPARRKFLKSDNVELANIMREFERMALVNNHLHMSIDTGAKLIDLRAGSFKQRIVDLFRSNLDKELLPVDVETSLVKIEGFISRPEYARRRNPLQYLIANERNMRHPYFHKAIMGCYDSLIASDTQPCYFLKFTVDPQTIDVNRSPTKDEIKFEYEQQIWPILQAAVKGALGKFSAMPSIDFTADVVPIQPLKEGEMPTRPEVTIPQGYNPFKNDYERKPSTTNWDSLYTRFTNPQTETVPEFEHSVETEATEDIKPIESTAASHSDSLFKEQITEAVAPICMQFAGKYIVTASREGLILIDQHRAHVKILFEEYMRRFENMDVVSQSVMFPETITLDETQQAVLIEVESDLRQMGFALEYDSETTWRIEAVPALLKNISSKDVIMRLIDSANESSENFGKENEVEKSIVARAALIMARSAAIRRNTKLSVSEMEHMIGELFRLPNPNLTPNGNKVMCRLDEARIDQLFNI